MAASYIFFHQALNLATFFLARRLFDTRVALLATYSVATLSLMVVFSTCISPDIPIALFSVLSLYAFLRGLDADRAGRRRSAYLWLACAGISVAFGYMAKESALILLPFYFVLWLYDGWRGNKWLLLKRGTMFAAGFFTMLAAEFAVLSYLNQGAYFRLGWVTAEMDEKDRAFIGRHGINPIERLQHVDNRLNAFFVPPGVKTFAIVCLAVFPFVRRRRWCLPAIALWTFGYLTFGSIRWGEYLPSSIQARYYIPVFPFLLIICAAVLVWLADFMRRRIPLVQPVRWLIFTGTIFIIVYPLVGLRGADELAGKIYRSDIVGAAAMAIQRAAEQDQRPIILSPRVSGRVYRMLYPATFENEIVQSNIKLDKVGSLRPYIDAGGWHYIKVYDPRRDPKRKAGDLIDPSDWLVPCPPPEKGEDPTLNSAQVVWSLDPTVFDVVELADYRLWVRSVQMLRLPHTRSGGLGAVHLKSLHDWAATRDPYVGGRGMLLGDIGTQRIPRDLQRKPPARETLKLEPDEWDARKTNAVQLDAPPSGGLRLKWAEAVDDYFWFAPRQGTHASTMAVAANTLCELIVDVAMTEGVSAHLVLSPLDENTSNRLRLRLSTGKNRLKIYAGDSPLALTPGLQVRGAGELVIRSWTLDLTPLGWFRDHTQLTGGWVLAEERDDCRVRENDRGGLNISFKLPQRVSVELRPPDSMIAEQFRLPSTRRCDVFLRVQFTKLVAASKVDVQFEVFEDPAAGEPVFTKRIELNDGENKFSLRTSDRPAYLRPIFILSGRGRFSIKEFTISSPR